MIITVFKEELYLSPNRGDDTRGDNKSPDETEETQRPSIAEYFERSADYYRRHGMDYEADGLQQEAEDIRELEQKIHKSS